MNDSSNGYHISFFKPTTPQAKANRNMVIWLVLIWSVAIFGFHFVLRIIEKPTPEPAYVSFEQIWGGIQNNNTQSADIQELGKVSLSVLGKIAIDKADKDALNNALSWSIYKLTEDTMKEDLVAKVQSFEQIRSEVTDIKDKGYMDAKIALGNELGPKLNLASLDIRTKILPLEITSGGLQELTEETKTQLPLIMSKYLIHNQSFLTDFKFLGFPFHYFYSAVFLLILFVALCWLYCVNTDKLNAKFNIVD